MSLCSKRWSGDNEKYTGAGDQFEMKIISGILEYQNIWTTIAYRIGTCMLYVVRITVFTVSLADGTESNRNIGNF